MSSEPTVYRITTFFKRRPDLTEEQFYEYWRNVHGPMVVPWALHHGVLQYTQYSTPSHFRTVIGTLMSSEFSAGLDFDAAADWYILSYERYIAAYADPYYINVIEPDECNFVDKSPAIEGKKTIVRAVTTLGYCRDIIKDGKSVEGFSDEIGEKWEEYKESRA